MARLLLEVHWKHKPEAQPVSIMQKFAAAACDQAEHWRNV